MNTMAEELVAQKALIFGKYDTSDVIINDGGLAKYIDLTPTKCPTPEESTPTGGSANPGSASSRG